MHLRRRWKGGQSLAWPAVYASNVGRRMLSDGRFPVNICNDILQVTSCVHLRLTVSWCIQTSQIVHSLSIQIPLHELWKISFLEVVLQLQQTGQKLTLCGTSSSGMPSFLASSRVYTCPLLGLCNCLSDMNIRNELLCNESTSTLAARCLHSVREFLLQRGTLTNKQLSVPTPNINA